MRDLDAGVLAEAVLEAGEHAALMVVADLPLLTDDRAEAFAEVVERLADANCEVIATTARADAPMELFGRRVVIGAAEMLVAREDLEEEPEGNGSAPTGVGRAHCRPCDGGLRRRSSWCSARAGRDALRKRSLPCGP